MAVNVTAHIACGFLILWNIYLLAAIESTRGKVKGKVRIGLQLVVVVCILALVLIWKVLP
jgi:hypothetical protein